ncbi:MAG: glycosyl hydrolase family 28 protein [Candidatus Hinthialibacter antarcticus]|nr:glycosyl hydrolase family 28 protein [Candidatus Hinthialibacter antarcticus]
MNGLYFNLLAAPRLFLILSVGAISLLNLTNLEAKTTFAVVEYGAVGDGLTLDTDAINQAISACAEAGGGQVVFTPGAYLTGSIHLKSHVGLTLEAGARIVGSQDLDQYQHPAIPSGKPESRWGKWHRGLIVGDNIENVSISGAGVIDGAKVFDPKGEEKMRGPHTVVFTGCRNVSVRDVTVIDSANYAFLFFASDDIEFRNVVMKGGWDGIHFRGWKDQPCRRITITGCEFYTGDDSIAGRYWDDVVISNCIINSSCNGIRVIGPADNLIIHDCLFFGPGRYDHRSSKRTNMLAGVNLQPGGWDATEGSSDNIVMSNLTMRDVATPFHFILKPGNTSDGIVVSRVDATGVYRSACTVESWAETPFKNVTFRDVSVRYLGGESKATMKTVKSPGVDARPLPAWGFYARNVEALRLENISLKFEEDDVRPVMMMENVNGLDIESLSASRSPHAKKTAIFNDVKAIQVDAAAQTFIGK